MKIDTITSAFAVSLSDLKVFEAKGWRMLKLFSILINGKLTVNVTLKRKEEVRHVKLEYPIEQSEVESTND